MIEEIKREMEHVSSWRWKISMKITKIALVSSIVLTCVWIAIFVVLVTTDKWWIGLILLTVFFIGCLILAFLLGWLKKKYQQAFYREEKERSEERS